MAAQLVLAAACLVMLGWYFHWPRVLQVNPAWAPMQFNTALGFLLIAVGMLLESRPLLRRAAGALLILMGSATLWQYAFATDLGIDELFMQHYLQTRTSHPGRMAPNTAAGFVLMGIAFLPGALSRWQRLLAAPAASLTLGLAALALAGYATNMTFAYGWRAMTSMAVHTAALFLLTSTALLTTQYRHSKKRPETLIQWQTATIIPAVVFVLLALQLPHIRGQELLQLDAAQADAELLTNRLETRMKLYGLRLPLDPDGSRLLADEIRFFTDKKNYHFNLLQDGVPLAGNYTGHWTALAEHPVYQDTHQLTVQLFNTEEHNNLFIGNFYFSLVVSGFIAALCVWLLRLNHTRMQAQAMLEASHNRLNVMFETSQHGLALLDPALNIQKKNPALDAISQAPAATNLHDLIHPALDSLQLDTLLQEPQFTLATRLAGTSVEITVSQLGLGGERLLTCKDLSMREQAEKASEKDSLIEQTLNATGSYLCLCDEAGEIFISNKPFDRAVGTDVADAGIRIVDYIQPEHRASFNTQFRQALDITGEPLSLDCQLRIDGRWIWCSCRITGNATNNSQQKLVTVNFQSIEEKRALIDQLESTIEQLSKANADVEQFAYIASHDLKSPLVGIKNLSEWLIEDYHDKLDEDGQNNLNLIRKRCDRMTLLLDDLLLYSRAGTRPLEPTSFSVNELARDLCQLHDCAEFTHITGDDVTLYSDRRALDIVLRNVISNAIKHNPRTDKQIRIHIQTGDFCTIEVEDNGPGVEPAYYDTIFQPFKTLKPRDQVEGSGMGLAITAKAIKRLHGRVSVNKSDLGGLKITLDVPPMTEQQHEQ
ncbi:ATP-binding protein [Simiduia agarivorans]|uniref:histidine kinase n=1 Tax=Simiduia agarivorans (strain DSM 21679 / JCM 13881 / BCRC 17597 / SA1) TaxID=1117647 RepID=K4KM78_SIMAS|nr:ATP-binding protein [Simiduia agarivorans]AFV00275.2 sensory transduction protein [Simiduia agarivorans SA1 = DSM 21679]